VHSETLSRKKEKREGRREGRGEEERKEGRREGASSYHYHVLSTQAPASVLSLQSGEPPSTVWEGLGEALPLGPSCGWGCGTLKVTAFLIKGSSGFNLYR
jgi:hypothetical protein